MCISPILVQSPSPHPLPSPVAAAERGQEVVVSLHETFAVGRFSIIPSVVFHLSIPDSFEGSWYTGKVVVGLKDAVFQASSPL